MTQPLVRFLDTPSAVVSAETFLPGVSAAEVYALVADPHRHHELDGAGSVQHQVSGSRNPGLGDTFTQFMKLYGIPYRMTSRVVQADPGAVFAWEMPSHHVWRWETTEEEGGVRVRETFDATRARVLGMSILPYLRLAGSFPRNRRGIATSLARLHRTFARQQR